VSVEYPRWPWFHGTITAGNMENEIEISTDFNQYKLENISGSGQRKGIVWFGGCRVLAVM
jgi:hypothetical protein